MSSLEQIQYRNTVYPSFDAIPIPRIKWNAALTQFPVPPPIVRTRYGLNGTSLHLLSYQEVNLPPSEESYVLACRTASVAVELYADRPVTIADIGTGSGVLAITIDKHLDHAGRQDYTVVATDISAQALTVAEQNAFINDNKNIKFRQRDMLSGVAAEFGKLDVIMCNPPFYHGYRVPEKVRKSKFIPDLAVNGGVDSLDFYRRLFSESQEVLSDDGFLIAQIQWYKQQAILAVKEKYMSRRSSIFIAGSRGLVSAIVIGSEKVVAAWQAMFP